MKYTMLFLLCAVSLRLAAQNPVTAQQQKMEPIKGMIGSWAGSGWIVLYDGKKHTFNQTEMVTAKMDGGLLTIEGNGKDTETGRPIQAAFAVLTYDNGKRSYRFSAYSFGYVTDVVPEIVQDGYTWSLATPMGKIRYTISFGNGQWDEKGELSKDEGKTWVQNFEMHLKKG